MFEGVKETLCTRCAHRDVCAHKQDYLDILKAVENATVTRDTLDGKIVSKKVIHYDFIGEISVKCKYHQNWTGNLSFRRSNSLKLHEKYTPYYERR